MAGSFRAVWTALAVAISVGAISEEEARAQPPLLERTDAIARQISTLRGLPLRGPIAKELVDREELRRRLLAMVARPKEAEEMRRAALLARIWGLIPEELDYHAMVIDVLTAQIAGYYDDETKKLTLTENPELDEEWSELVLVHEIEHALQDQSFALTKLRDVPQGEDDSATARQALVEGDGIAVMLEMTATKNGTPLPWSNAPAIAAVAAALAESTEPDDDLKDVPLAIREQLAFPYRAGFAFIAALRRQQPWRAVDAAFRKPPLSTEQILHPQLYSQNEAPLVVPKLALPAPLVDRLAGKAAGAAKLAPVETVWGELGFLLWLRSHGVHRDMAEAAAAGWGGDRVSVVPRGDGKRELGVARLRWDSEADAREAFDAAVLAMDQWLTAALLEHTDTRARWIDLFGRVSTVERRGSALVVIKRAPLSALAALDAELWRSLPALSSAKPR